MKSRLAALWDAVVNSYLFIPLLMAAAAIGLGIGLVQFDRGIPPAALRHAYFIYSGDAGGALSVLSTIATSIITVASVTFSITIAALSLASQQYGPRLLRSFVRDHRNQVVLGTFVGTFLYDLVVIRTIRSATNGGFVPAVSVTVGILLAIASIVLFVYFIHHVSISIAPEHVIAAVGKELDGTIDRLYAQLIANEPSSGLSDAVPAPPQAGRNARAVPARRPGYVQAIDADQLMSVARRHDLVIKVLERPGRYVAAAGTALALAWPGERATDGALRGIAGAFVTGLRRTMIGDADFGVNQLVSVAVRALSPGINAPFTAVMCVDRLGTSLCRLAGRTIPSPLRYDRDGTLRVIAPATTFPEMVESALAPIRQYGSNSVPVAVALLGTIAKIAPHVSRDDDRAALRTQAELIDEAAGKSLQLVADRDAVADSYAAASAALAEPFYEA